MAEAVCVGVRVRPFNSREQGLNAQCCIEMNGPTTTITNPETKEAKPFAFDESFWSHDGFEDDGAGYMRPLPGTKYADQRYVFDTFGQRVLDNAWNGFHCCLFAYGQTGAGKSYSMVGYGKNKGIVPISCEEIFNRIGSESDPEKKYEVTVSMIEIYNEAIQDLLIECDQRPKKGLEIRESKALGIYIEGVVKRPVDSYPAIEATIEEATNHRTVGSTLMNATSSRAHTVQIIEFKKVANGCPSVSMINLVDLAGSEKAGQTGATGDRLKEGSAINKSLSALGNVIEKLAEKATGKGKNILIPYRDSKLTRLLQNALGGSSKTIMVCALSPASSNYEETLSTLRYADRAKKIKNTAVVNENPQERLMRELKEENNKLKELIESMQGGKMPDANCIKEMAARQKEIAAVEGALQDMNKSFEQKLAEEKERQKHAAEKRRFQSLRSSMPGGQSYPMLVNLNDDGFLTGRIRHNCYPGRNLIGGLVQESSSESSSDDDDDSDDDDSDEQTQDTEDADSDVEEEPDILIRAEGVERHHAIVFCRGGKTWIYPCSEGCAMLTYVNGRALSDLHKSSDEDQEDNEDSEGMHEHTKKEEEAGRDGDEVRKKEKQFVKPAGKGILLAHGDRLAFSSNYWVFVVPSVMTAELLIASGQVDYQAAKKEWQAEQRATLNARFGSAHSSRGVNCLGIGSSAADAAELAEKTEEIRRQGEEIAKLKAELEALRQEKLASSGALLSSGSGGSAGVAASLLAAGGGRGLPAAKAADHNQKVDSIVLSIQSTFADAMSKMKALEDSVTSKKHLAAMST
eukprot:TRINITY_DN73531_c0_g1_i1.p1 TRINITY_DN73531_c0_g1~~TRINITY_DN73531_c0_g1_i1.p1  ORF type:complete len:828 (+),score=192.69 TRINITY_DN73531_c0_g1_i1:80-2485(+)